MSTKTSRIIGTHNGKFHCDEVLGCWMLKQTDQYKEAEITRTRDNDILKDLDIIIDVGGIYDYEKRRFDHHQKGFNENFGHGFVTKLSSAGLVYKHFGKEIIKKILKADDIDEKLLNIFYLKVYEGFIENVDGNDNGINRWISDEAPRYQDNTSLASRIHYLNPDWNEPSTEEIELIQFKKAMETSGTELTNYINFVYKSWYPAKAIVEKAINERFEIHPSGKIIILDQICPWKEHLFKIEEDKNIANSILYCIFKDRNQWITQAVSVSLGLFENRKSLPKPWCGLRDETLDEVTGIPGGIFVHASGFIGGHKTKEGALEMVIKALNY